MADHPLEASLMVAVSGFSPNYTMAGSWVFLSQMLTFLITRGFGMTLSFIFSSYKCKTH